MSRKSDVTLYSDEQGQLVARGERHVDQRDQAHDHDRVERTPVPERRVGREHRGAPHEQAEHQEEVAVFVGELLVEDDEVDHGPDERPRGRLEGRERAAFLDQDVADDERHDQRGEGRPDQVRPPAAPSDLDPDQPGEHAQDRHREEEVGEVLAGEDRRHVVDRDRHRGAQQGDERDRQPALGRRQREAARSDRPGHRIRTSPSGRPGRDHVEGQLVLGEGVPQRARALGRRLRLGRVDDDLPARCGGLSDLADPVVFADIERDDDARDAPRPQARERAHPRGIERRRDHDGRHPAPETTDGGDERLDERGLPVGLDGGEELHDLLVLAAAPVGRQERGPAGVHGEADRPVLGDRLVRDGRRDPDGRLGRRFIAAAAADAPLQVEDDPGVRGLFQVELLDLELAVARRRLPVDPVHRVARGIRPDRCRERRRLERPLGRRVAALQDRRGQAPGRDRFESRVDDDRDALADGGRRLEEAERIAGPDVERLDPEVPAPRERHADEPRALTPPPERDGPARQGAWQGRRVVDLEPELREPAAVAERVGDPHPVADMAVQLADRVPGLEVGQAQADQDVGAADDQDREVEQVEEVRKPGRERRDDEEGGDEQQLEPADHASRPPGSIRPTIRVLGAGNGRRARRAAQAGRPARPRGPDALDRGGLEQFPDDLAGLDVVDRRTRLDDQAVRQGGLGQRLDVIGDDVVPAEEAGQRLARPVQGDRTARRGAQVHVGMAPGRADKPNDVVGDARIDVDLADGFLHPAQFLDRQDLLEVLERVRPLLLIEDDDLLDRLRVAEAKAQHEPVQLCLGQGERALVLDRVLGRDDEERIRHRVGRAVDRRLTLLHAFEERGLGLRGRPVDLVGEHDLAEDRAGAELELLGLLVVDREPRDVGRQQVGGELDPPEGGAEAPGDRLGEHGLAGARHVLDEQVAATQQGDQGQTDFVVLADDDALDVGEDPVAGLLDLGHQPLSRGGRRRGTPRAAGSWGATSPGGLMCRRRIVRLASAIGSGRPR